MYSSSDLRKGLKIEIDGQPWAITDFNFSKPGKGQAIYMCKLKNMIDGRTMSRNFRSNDKFGKPSLESKSLIYSFPDGDNYVFMDENYEQLTITAETIGDTSNFLVEEMDCEILFFNDEPIDIELPTFIERQITQAEPGARGNTASGNVTKPATLSSGYTLQVPIFINEGDYIKIDTRTGEYAERVNR